MRGLYHRTHRSDVLCGKVLCQHIYGGLARELEETGAKMKAKVLSPAATKTEFGMVANNVNEYGYDKSFGTYHTSKQVAGFLLKLYDSEKVVGLVDREDFSFRLADPLFPYAGKLSHNHGLRQEHSNINIILFYNLR